jgi:hypothetical protein
MPPPPRVRCRQINTADIEDIVNLLTKGFDRKRNFWERAFRRLSEHHTPPGFPKYGYLLESDGSVVGVILLIFSAYPFRQGEEIRCNVSSWYVNPEFRSCATMLISAALRHRNVTYFNITPDPHTWPILEAQGYRRYASGVFVAVPALNGWARGSRVSLLTPDARVDQDLQPAEIELLMAHAKYGSYSLICSSAGRRHPFVIAPRRHYGGMPLAHLLYCRDVEDFVRFAGPLGWFLARRGLFFVALDANGPVQGLCGRYVDNRPKYYRGANPPHLGDLAYSERAIFGV